jgi:AAA+ ATPase superfamily predicted ATPase
MSKIIIGREEEKGILNGLLDDSGAQLLAIYGRRRIGKTYLVKTFFSDQLVFDCSGEANGLLATQLENFSVRLAEYSGIKKMETPATWQAAFRLLEESLTKN